MAASSSLLLSPNLDLLECFPGKLGFLVYFSTCFVAGFTAK